MPLPFAALIQTEPILKQNISQVITSWIPGNIIQVIILSNILTIQPMEIKFLNPETAVLPAIRLKMK